MVQLSSKFDPGHQWKVTTSQLDITNESQEVSPFPVGDHKASINRRTRKRNKKRQKEHKLSTKEAPSWNGQRKYFIGGFKLVSPHANLPISVLVISNNKPVCPVLQCNNQLCVHQLTIFDLLPVFYHHLLILLVDSNYLPLKNGLFCRQWRGFFVSPFIALLPSGKIFTQSLLRLCQLCSSFTY